MNHKTATTIQLSFKKKLLFSGILATLFLFVLLFSLEMGLRLIGFGNSSSFYQVIENENGEKCFRENRDFTVPYFSNNLKRSPQPFRIPYEKSAYRIFVLGSSAAMGDPESSFSISRSLEVLLESAYPDIEFEVVNAAITAINSHIVRKIANDCVDLDPDLYIIYEGNNEVIGPYGPSGVLAPFISSEMAIRSIMLLKQSRIGQLITAINSGSSEIEDWGGMEMFLEQNIPYGDKRLDVVNELFKKNLNAIIHAAEKANIESLLCTVLVNQKDFAPFQSSHKEGLNELELGQWKSLIEEGDKSLSSSNYRAAVKSYKEATLIDDFHAESFFKLASAYMLLEQFDSAKTAYLRAVELDTIRFRTSADLNRVIRQVAKENQATAKLVDLEQQICALADGNLLGQKWLYEHVHLTFYASYHTASILFKEVSEELLRENKIKKVEAIPLSYKEMTHRLAYTLYEQAMIIESLLDRFQKAPFTEQYDNEQRIHLWKLRQNTAHSILNTIKDPNELFSIYETALTYRPDDWILARNYGMALLSFNNPKRALHWLQKAYGVINDDPDLLFALGMGFKSLGKQAEADHILTELEELEPRYPGLQQK